MRDNLCLQQLYETRLHVIVVVWDIQADDTYRAKMALELGGELGAMRSLHDEDGVRPLKKFRCDRVLRFILETG